jgi:hypothetical protein
MNKKNIIYLAVLIVLIIIFLIIKTNDRTERRINFFAVDSADIAKIEIATSKDTLILVKEDEGWMIQKPLYYPPAERKVKDLFDKALKVETSNLPVSESESSFETYNVTDSLGTRVLLYDSADKELVNAIIGKSSNYNFSHGRYADEKKVYQLYANISSILNPVLNSWREKEIIKLEEEPSQITVGAGERMFSFTATDSLWKYTEGDTSFFIKEGNRQLTTLLNNSKSFRASSFIDNDYATYAELFQDPLMVVQIRTYDGENIFLKFISEGEESNKYIVQKNDEEDFLYVVYDNLFRSFQPDIELLKK